MVAQARAGGCGGSRDRDVEHVRGPGAGVRLDFVAVEGRWHLGLRAATLLPREPVQTGAASLASRRNLLESQFVGKPSSVITYRPDPAGPEEALEYLFRFVAGSTNVRMKGRRGVIKQKKKEIPKMTHGILCKEIR